MPTAMSPITQPAYCGWVIGLHSQRSATCFIYVTLRSPIIQSVEIGMVWGVRGHTQNRKYMTYPSRQRRTSNASQATYTKIGKDQLSHSVFESCEQKYKQTCRQADVLNTILCAPSRGKVFNVKSWQCQGALIPEFTLYGKNVNNQQNIVRRERLLLKLLSGE